jgi:hypothetical protein
MTTMTMTVMMTKSWIGRSTPPEQGGDGRDRASGLFTISSVADVVSPKEEVP